MSSEFLNYGPKYWELVDKLSAEIEAEISNYPLASKVDKRKIISKVMSKNLRVFMVDKIVTEKELESANVPSSKILFQKNVEDLTEAIRKSQVFFHRVVREENSRWNETLCRSCLVVLVP